ncbi:polyprenyl synthetase family protein [Campylobacter sp. MIT 97-5078]|uniref:polyprenyl synthetase family protein n=1 Tax=Campylobacter sp. MIT 97-5078 TaxID=1548153 RepID=UPI0005142B34|nr:polyprenyl synthetase family protein [Campylobacter sp. MIT 97-5078]KGI57015.1 octaprenyl-diphosphate synthase [Campylobacter sp. MIT 97-5078]TQR28154.1 polyprenyl synthetase family protein [Campylobacter sp. MIT 97-5078]
MQEIDEFIASFIKDLEYKPILLMCSKLKPGKKLRSKLLLNIAKPSQEAFKICALIELIHLASLLHDDVIDEAELRRGAKSINAEFGAKNTIMLGDILYSKAFFELSKLDTSFAQIISNAVLKLSKGELMDIELSKSFNDDEKAYLEMIDHKTAALIEASARCGAILAGFDEEKFALYGKNLGIAFQIVDDILDIKNDAQTLGKPAMNDFKEGKCTLAYIFAHKNLQKDEKIKLESLFKKELCQDEATWLKDIIAPYLDQSFILAKNYTQRALKAIESYHNEALEDIAKTMINREF